MPTETPFTFTYSVYTEIGVAPAGRIFLFVSIDPPGDYSVTYKGSSLGPSGRTGEYYIITDILDDGNYASNVSVAKR